MLTRISNAEIGNMTKRELRCACVDLRIERDRLAVQREVFELCGKLVYLQDMEAVRNLAKRLLDSYTDDDYM